MNDHAAAAAHGWQVARRADLVSEIQPIKHPFDKGIKAQRGIEF